LPVQFFDPQFLVETVGQTSEQVSPLDAVFPHGHCVTPFIVTGLAVGEVEGPGVGWLATG